MWCPLSDSNRDFTASKTVLSTNWSKRALIKFHLVLHYFINNCMKYYKELNLDCSIVTAKLLEYTKNNPTTTFWTSVDVQTMITDIPELLDMIAPLKLTIAAISIVTSVDQLSSIHKDDTLFKTRMNIPILNCEYSTTSFFTSDVSEGELKHLPNGIPYLYFNPDKCTEVASFTLTKPTLLRIRELHQIRINDPSKMPRISCTIGFYENTDHLWHI